jgi:flagellar motor component MotA
VLVLVGYIVVIGAVFGGYGLMGGHFGVLFQPIELLMIGGSALGAFIAGNNGKTIKATMQASCPGCCVRPNTTASSTWTCWPFSMNCSPRRARKG